MMRKACCLILFLFCISTQIFGQADRDTLWYNIQPEHIARTSISQNSHTDKYYINVHLKKDYHLKFALLTGENIGNVFAVTYKGEIISPSLPTLTAQLTNGSFIIGFFDEKQKAKKTLQTLGLKITSADSLSSQDKVQKAFNDLLAFVGPDPIIDYQRVYRVLDEEKDITFKDVAFTKDAEGVQQLIKKLKALIHNKRITSDKKLTHFVYGLLGSQFLQLFNLTKDARYLDQAITYARKAIAVFEGNSMYKPVLTGPYNVLASAYYLKGNNKKSIALTKQLIEEFQDIDYGPYNNWFASHQVVRLYNMTQRGDLNKDIKRSIIHYLQTIAKKYDNEVGVIAQKELLKHYLTVNKIDEAKAISGSINNRLASIDNPKFETKIHHAVIRLLAKADVKKPHSME